MTSVSDLWLGVFWVNIKKLSRAESCVGPLGFLRDSEAAWSSVLWLSGLHRLQVEKKTLCTKTPAPLSMLSLDWSAEGRCSHSWPAPAPLWCTSQRDVIPFTARGGESASRDAHEKASFTDPMQAELPSSCTQILASVTYTSLFPFSSLYTVSSPGLIWFSKYTQQNLLYV